MSDTSIALNEGQANAVRAACKWYNMPAEHRPQVFRLFGYAGTGKTTALKHIIEGLGVDRVAFAAYTGKAALVMRDRGHDASTIHRLIYAASVDNVLIEQLVGELEMYRRNGWDTGFVEQRLALAKRPRFGLRYGLEGDPQLLVLDECSMVAGKLLDDLRSFGIPMLVMGDPGQLPPIRPKGDTSPGLCDASPDVMLTQVMRQAEGSAIPVFAEFLRQGGEPTPGVDYGDGVTVSRWHPGINDEMLAADQVIAGKNTNRHSLNRHIRSLNGCAPAMPDAVSTLEPTWILPRPGEKLVCVRNKGDFVNGGFVDLEHIDLERRGSGVAAKVDGLDVILWTGHFDHCYSGQRTATPPDPRRPYETAAQLDLDYAYAITAHKSQGSEWDHVVVVDDGLKADDAEFRARWLYTAATRARQRLTIVRV